MAKLKTATRTIRNAGIRRVVGEFYSHKNGRSVVWESLLERDALYDAEFDKEVVGYIPQPCQFTYFLDGRTAVYTPDMEVTLRDGSVAYREVKPDSKVDAPEAQSKWNAIERVLARQGYAFEFVRASDIERGHRAHNLRLLYRYARWPDVELAVAELERHVSTAPESTVASLRLVLKRWGMDPAAVYHALFHQRLRCDLEREVIDGRTLVWGVAA